MREDQKKFLKCLEYAYKKGFKDGRGLDDFDTSDGVYKDILEKAIKKTRKDFKKNFNYFYL